MTGDVDRHEAKRGAPDYRGMLKDEVIAHEKTLRSLASKQRNEVSLLTNIENLREENQELNKTDIIHIKTECLQCSKQEKLKKEIEDLAMYKPIAWTLIGVILLIITGALLR